MPVVLVNDGSVQHGSRDITIGATTYATDDFSLDTDSSEILRTDQRTVLSGRVTIKQATKGSCTLQLADENTALPVFGDQFTETEGVFTVTAVGRKETKGAETKVPISFVLNITTDITTET